MQRYTFLGEIPSFSYTFLGETIKFYTLNFIHFSQPIAIKLHDDLMQLRALS